MKFCKHFLTNILIGGLLGIGFIFPILWPFGVLGGAWYIAKLLSDERLWNWRSSYLVWLVKSLILTSWVWSVYPIDWLTISLGVYELPLIGFYWFTVSASLAVGGLVFHNLVRFWQKHTSKLPIIYLVPVFWLLAEVAGSFIFSLLMYGPGGTIGTEFSLGYSGYLLAQHQWLIWLAKIGGVYALTLAFGALITFSYWLYYWRQKLMMTTLVVFVLVTQFISIAINEESDVSFHTVVTVDTYFNAPDLQDEEGAKAVRKSLVSAMEVAESITPDYIVLPEDTDLFTQRKNQQSLNETLRFLYGDTDTIIVDSGQVDYGEKDVMQVAIYDGETEILKQSHKRYLVPQGEYMPYLYRFVLGLFDRDDVTELLNERLDLVVGHNTSQASYAEDLPGVLFCFEVVDPKGVRSLIKERKNMPFIAHIVSHSWIHESTPFRKQLETMLQVQAIWNDIHIVVAGNELPGFAVTSTGLIVQPEVIGSGEDWSVGLVRIPRH